MKQEAKEGAAIDLRGHSTLAFGTPLVSYPWPESDALNEALRELILERERDSEGLSRSNVRGWHSDTDFFQWDADCIRTLQGSVQELTTALSRSITLTPDGRPRSFNYRLDGWANVSRRGSYNTVHNHPNCLWSGTYYVSPGIPDEGQPHNGKLELLDPRVGANLNYIKGTILESRYIIDPLPGLMVMFPSWLSHFVHPFFGDGERISVAFNVVATEVPAADELA